MLHAKLLDEQRNPLFFSSLLTLLTSWQPEDSSVTLSFLASYFPNPDPNFELYSTLQVQVRLVGQ